jgi:primosomal protein N' (replication factor Y)
MAGTCEVALALPLRNTFSYAIPDALEQTVMPGARVLVPFRNRSLIGVVLEVNRLEVSTAEASGPGASAPPANELGIHGATALAPSKTAAPPYTQPLKSVAEVLDAQPALSPQLIALGRWVASYYLAPVGETFRAMLPPAVKPRPPRMQTVAAWKGDASSVPSNEPSQRPGKARAAELQKQAKVRQALTERGPVLLAHLVKIAGVSRKVIERLARQGNVELWEEPAAPPESAFDADFLLPPDIPGAGLPHELNDEQQSAFGEIRGWLDAARAGQGGGFNVGLLYGVTGSGKTEVYLRAVEATLERGRTALILVPEIALTLRVGRLCHARFGGGPAASSGPAGASSPTCAAGVAVLHSGLSDQERAREWWRVRRGEARVVVGTRSAVFAPLENMGLIIVDEEQESSYKQEETPRYNGRDVAIVRAKLEGAVALLGSATPSMESFHHARQGKYKLLRLDARIANRPLAPVEIVDLREDFRQTHRAGPVSERLRAAVGESLAAGTQALVLINRRGYSFFALCRSCGAAILCENCSIALAYHRRRERLECHYCGYSRRVPKACPKCSSEHLYFVGAGAEQLEERLQTLFPQARIARLDRDTARSKRVYEQVLGAFAARSIDILVGTQMVAKGHDFQSVTLVGVVSADAQLGFPDFRAAERTFQLLTQVAGRAGRGDLAGRVLVETHYPEHYAIELAARQDYPSFFEKELHFRRMMHYPPFTSLALLLVRDTKLEHAIRWSRQIGAFLEPMESRGIKVLGPAAAPLARLKREYRFQFLLKSPRRALLNRVLGECLAFCDQTEIPSRAVMVDVDPVNLL